MGEMKSTETVEGKNRRSLYWLAAASAAVFAAGLVLQGWRPQIAVEAMSLRLIALIAFTTFALWRRSLTV